MSVDNDYTAGSTKQAENIKYKQTQRGHKHFGYYQQLNVFGFRKSLSQGVFYRRHLWNNMFIQLTVLPRQKMPSTNKPRELNKAEPL